MKRILKSVTAVFLVLVMLVPGVSFAKTFTDVGEGKWYTDAVNYVTEKGYFTGTTQTTFEPKTIMSRAMFVTILAAHSGDDISSFSADQFRDVSSTSWYDKAVGWAYENQIVSGVSEDMFAPKASVTRQEVCLMLDKYIAYRGYTLYGKNYEISSDDASISSWAKKSVYEIKGYGVVTGKEGNRIDPKGIATRAEVAQMMMKLDEVIKRCKGLNIDVVDIKIEGMTKDVKILHVSDTHVTLTDLNDPEAAVEYQNARKALFAAEIADEVDSKERFDNYFDFADGIGADLVALTGDIIDAPTSGNLNHFKATLEKSKVDHLYAFGNHDWTAEWLNATHGGYQSRQQRDLHVPMFDGIIGEGEADVAVRDFGEFKVIAIDNSDNQVSAAQLQAVYEHLDGSGDDKPVILLMHVPLYIESMVNDVVGMWGNAILMGSPSTNPTYQTRMFCQLLESDQSPVVAILAGHVHMDHVDDVSARNDTVQYTLGASYQGYARVFNIHG